MKVNYKPEACKRDDKQFDGELVLRMPSYEERLEIAANPDTMDAMKGNAEKNMAAMLHMLKWSYQFYEKVELVHIESKKKYKSLDDLRYDHRASEILNEVAMSLSTGLTEGK